jgi:cellulose synthase (UDP-forming)
MCVALGIAALVAPHLRREWPWVRFAVLAFSLCMLARYLLWRTFSTLPHWELSLQAFGAYALFGFELLVTFLAVRDQLVLVHFKNRSAEVEQYLDFYAPAAPRVDLLIATYNEPWEVLEKSLLGAQHQNYPNYAVWVLDDGNRAWLRERCELCGVGYVARTDNRHYKAGNLNHGLDVLRSQGVRLEFLALLDADFVAQPEFVRRTLALMHEPNVGIVQTPQCFYNPDPHQQAFGGVECWPDEQRSWFGAYLPALDAVGAASCCGTSCLLRASALQAIGGFPTESVCEDTLTSIKMRRAGFKTVFLDERLTVGLAPEGIGEFLTQRARWLLGGVQNTRVIGPAPGIGGKIMYFLMLWRMAIYGAIRPAWVGTCALFWFTGVSLLQIEDAEQAVSYFGPLWLDRVFQGWLFNGTRMLFVTDAVFWLLSPLWIRETYRAVTGSNARFKVTDKAVHRDRRVAHWRLLPFHAAMMALLVGGVLYTVLDSNAPAHHNGLFQANTWMSLYFVLVIAAGTAPVFEPPKRRLAERYATREAFDVRWATGNARWSARDISIGGVRLVPNRDCAVPEQVWIDVGDVGSLPARKLRTLVDRSVVYVFEPSTPAQRDGLIRQLYCTDRYIRVAREWQLGTAFRAFTRHLVT